MIEEADLKNNLREEEFKKLFLFKGYFRLAWQFAKLKKINSNNDAAEKTLLAFDEDTQKSIKSLAAPMLKFIDEHPEFDLSTPAFEENWSQNDIQAFYEQYPFLMGSGLDKKVWEDLETQKSNGNIWNKWIASPLSVAAEVCESASFKYPVPPADVILLMIQTGLAFFANRANQKAMKYDPAIQPLPEKVTAYPKFGLFGGAVALLGIGMGVLFTGPLVTVLAPFLTATGALGVSLISLIAFGRSISAFVREIRKNKDPKETHGLRIFQKGLECLKSAMITAFYISVSILAVAAVVALFAHPVGLGALAGGMATFALATVGLSVGTAILSKVSEWRIKKITERSLQEQVELEKKPGTDNAVELTQKNLLENKEEVSHRAQTDQAFETRASASLSQTVQPETVGASKAESLESQKESPEKTDRKHMTFSFKSVKANFTRTKHAAEEAAHRKRNKPNA